MSEIGKISLSRREMLRLSAGAAGAAALGAETGAAGGPAPLPAAGAPGRVVSVHMPGFKGELFPRADAARVMIDRAVRALAGESDTGRAWLKFVRPDDRVLLKVNCLGTRFASSAVEVTGAVAEALRAVGVPDENLLVMDMFASNMIGGRYRMTSVPGRMRVMAHRDAGYHRGWIEAGPARAKLSKLLTWSTAVIDIPPIKDHDLAGVTCAMKNVTFGAVEKPHLNHDVINEAICHLWALDEIRSRVRLIIADGSSVLYEGGPKYRGSMHARHDRIYATADPVAMDAIAHQLIAALRSTNGLRTLAAVGRPPRYIDLAEEMGLGVADPARIDHQLIELPPYGEGREARGAASGAEVEAP